MILNLYQLFVYEWTIQPSNLLVPKELNIMFHLDGTQILSNGIFSWKDLKCDFLSLSAHKFGGPKGQYF